MSPVNSLNIGFTRGITNESDIAGLWSKEYQIQHGEEEGGGVKSTSQHRSAVEHQRNQERPDRV